MARFLFAISLMMAGFCPVLAQSVNGPGDDVLCSGYTAPRLVSGDIQKAPPRLSPQPPIYAVTGKPVSFRRVTQDLQTLADGTRICSAPVISVYYRDSAGRTRDEQFFGIKGSDGNAAPFIVRILDPVAQIAYTLDMANRTAYRVVAMKPEDIKPVPPGIPSPPIPELVSKTVSLGEHSFQGADVEGKLITTTATLPGAAAPISITDETWNSPYLSQAVLRKSVSPGNSRTDATLHISMADPDPTLFRVPTGWKIVDGAITPPLGGGNERHTAAGYQYTWTIVPPTRADFVVRDAPYSAVRTGTATANLAGLSERPPNISQPSRLYRDPYGRTRQEIPRMSSQFGDNVSPPVFPEIDDPIDGTQIILDPVHKIAHRFVLSESSTISPARVAFGYSNHINSIESSRDLGEGTIAGVGVEGTLQTYRTPAGANGNDRELTETTESWYSPDLRIIVRAKFHTVTQNSTMELTNISTTEPDPALFEIPADYKVVDEKGPVTITVTQP